jgi:hypothetical protein
MAHIAEYFRACRRARGIRALTLIVALCSAGVGLANAHDPLHPEWTDWLMSQKNQNNGECCNGQDTLVLSDSEWKVVGDHYEVFHNGTWMSVPRWALTQGTDNITGHALLWVFNMRVMCFKPGTFY